MKLRVTVEGKAYEVDIEILDAEPRVGSAPNVLGASPAPTAPTGTKEPAARPPPKPLSAPAAGEVRSPLAGTVLSVAVKVGATVSVNDTLMVLEAMKMESNVASPVAGTIQTIEVAAGTVVTAGQVLVRIG